MYTDSEYILSMFPSGWIPLVYELMQMYRSSSAMVWEILNSESSMTLSTHFTFNIIRMCVDVHDFHSYLSVNDSTQRRAEFYNFDQLLLFNLVYLATCIHDSIKSAKCKVSFPSLICFPYHWHVHARITIITRTKGIRPLEYRQDIPCTLLEAQ